MAVRLKNRCCERTIHPRYLSHGQMGEVVEWYGLSFKHDYKPGAVVQRCHSTLIVIGSSDYYGNIRNAHQDCRVKPIDPETKLALVYE